MIYCNAKRCGKYKSCIIHICNLKTDEQVNIKDYSGAACTKDMAYPLYKSISCSKCGSSKKIFANDMCKVCYNRTKKEEGVWNFKKSKSNYIPTGKPRGIAPDRAKVEQIIELRKKGKTYNEIGIIVGLSRQRVQQICKKQMAEGGLGCEI